MQSNCKGCKSTFCKTFCLADNDIITLLKTIKDKAKRTNSVLKKKKLAIGLITTRRR